jgi:hypothetical protein
MRPATRPRILPILVALSAASLSACTHAPNGTGTPIKENSPMSTDRNTVALQTRLGAETALSKVLELLRDSKSIQDFTAEKIAGITGLAMQAGGSGRFTASETLTPDWWYSIEMVKATVNGPQFMFGFHPAKPGSTPSATPVCGMDFTAFSDQLESMGFSKQVRHGEHGRILSYQFYRSGLAVTVGTRGENEESDENVRHQCVSTVTIN